MSLDNEPSSISPWAFGLGAVVIVGAAMAAIWFAFPGPDTKLRLVAPSGHAALELGELCPDGGCSRVAIFETAAEDGTPLRTGCSFDLPGNTPLFASVIPTWAPDESSVKIAYAAGESITFRKADCTITQ